MKVCIPKTITMHNEKNHFVSRIALITFAEVVNLMG